MLVGLGITQDSGGDALFKEPVNNAIHMYPACLSCGGALDDPGFGGTFARKRAEDLSVLIATWQS